MTVAEAQVDDYAAARPAVRARWRWQDVLARPEQLTPEGDWNVWLYMAGRGSGKTRAAAEDMAYYALTHSETRLAVIAPTYADARDTCIEGESGLLAVIPREEVSAWNRSLGELVLRNGARFKLFSGDEPDRLRGPQHHRAWFDELAAFRYRETWDLAMMTLRLGDRPRAIVTTTPRPIYLMRELIARDDVLVTRGSTFDNADNLAPAALESLRRRYGGTRMGRQELEGLLLEEAEGALWRREWIEAGRVSSPPRGWWRTKVLGLDPADGLEDGDEQAWCLAGIAAENHELYVEHSEGMRVSPLKWLKAAVELAHDEDAEMVVEKNHGGKYLVELLETAMRELGIRAPYKVIDASQGKMTRAEPVAMLYEQGVNTGHPFVHHIGDFPELEDQLCNFTGTKGERSPDRLDALVWAVKRLMAYSRGSSAPPDSGAVPYREDRTGKGAVAWR